MEELVETNGRSLSQVLDVLGRMVELLARLGVDQGQALVLLEELLATNETVPNMAVVTAVNGGADEAVVSGRALLARLDLLMKILSDGQGRIAEGLEQVRADCVRGHVDQLQVGMTRHSQDREERRWQHVKTTDGIETILKTLEDGLEKNERRTNGLLGALDTLRHLHFKRRVQLEAGLGMLDELVAAGRTLLQGNVSMDEIVQHYQLLSRTLTGLRQDESYHYWHRLSNCESRIS